MTPARSRAAHVAGLASFAYVVWYVGSLVLLGLNPSAYNRFNQFYASVGARAVLAAVLGALIFHLLDGLRATAQQFLPRFAGHELVLRSAVGFLTFALWIPGALIVMWPAIRSWFSR